MPPRPISHHLFYICRIWMKPTFCPPNASSVESQSAFQSSSLETSQRTQWTSLKSSNLGNNFVKNRIYKPFYYLFFPVCLCQRLRRPPPLLLLHVAHGHALGAGPKTFFFKFWKLFGKQLQVTHLSEASANARPKPWAEPVTITTLPERDILCMGTK